MSFNFPPIMDGDSCPWKDAEHVYAGWVPNVSGQLSFSIIGSGGLADRVTSCNAILKKNNVRFVAAHQYRVTRDRLLSQFLPIWLVRRFRPEDAADYYLIAQTAHATMPVSASIVTNSDEKHCSSVKTVNNAQGSLAGWLIMLPARDKVCLSEQSARNIILQSIQGHASLSEITDFPVTIQESVQSYYNEHKGCFIVEFILYRNGEVRIWQSKERTPFIDLNDKITHEDICNQMFYYLKDLVHRHYHHESDSDNINTLSDISETETQEDPEVKWRRHALWSLTRTAMQFRRVGRWHHLNRALGVLAYAEAFQTNFLDRKRISSRSMGSEHHLPIFTPCSDIQSYDFGHLRDSLKVSIDENHFERTARWQLLTIILAVVFSVFAIRFQSIALIERVNGSVLPLNALQRGLNFLFVDAFPVGVTIFAVTVGLAYHVLLRDQPVFAAKSLRRIRRIVFALRSLLDIIYLGLLKWAGGRRFRRIIVSLIAPRVLVFIPLGVLIAIFWVSNIISLW